VQWCQKGKIEETALAIYKRQAQRLDSIKGVVYCRSREQYKEMARLLECAYYYTRLVNREERLKKWVKAGGFIVVTSALGTGVDYEGIIFVLHVGLPYGMIDYAQESGRAGRGGEAVDLVVLLENGDVGITRSWGHSGAILRV